MECYSRGKLSVGAGTYIGRSRIFCAHSVVIGNGVYISDFVVIFDSNLHPVSGSRRREDLRAWLAGKFPDVYTGIPFSAVTIGDLAWIGASCVIGKGVVVGEGAIVGAGSVLVRDVAPYTIVAGNHRETDPRVGAE